MIHTHTHTFVTNIKGRRREAQSDLQESATAEPYNKVV